MHSLVGKIILALFVYGEVATRSRVVNTALLLPLHLGFDGSRLHSERELLLVSDFPQFEPVSRL